jgi:hypothetical protein
MNELRNQIHNTCLQVLNHKINILREDLLDLSRGNENDSKSSAGDKHETANAMMHLEYERTGKLMNELLVQKKNLENQAAVLNPHTIVLGSMIRTDRGIFYLSIPLGKIHVGEISVMVLSPQSPLGMLFMGSKEGSVLEWNNVKYQIENIF